MSEHDEVNCEICWILDGYRLRDEQFGNYDTKEKAHAAIAHLTAQAEERGAKELAEKLKRVFELGKLATPERDFAFGAIDHALAALNPTDTQSRGEA